MYYLPMDLNDIDRWQQSETYVRTLSPVLNDLEKCTTVLASSALERLKLQDASGVEKLAEMIRNAENNSLTRITKMLQATHLPNLTDSMLGLGITSNIKSMLEVQTHIPRIESIRPPLPEFSAPVNPTIPIQHKIQTVTNVIAESVQELSQRLEYLENQMRQNSETQSAQTEQQIRILENLVTISAATSAGNELAMKRSDEAMKRGERISRNALKVTIIAALAAIIQCIIPILMHYLFR